MDRDDSSLRQIQRACETLHQSGHKMTPQRYMIVEAILQADEHMSVYQIVERVQERNPCVTLSTVYRTLEVLQEVGFVREVHLPGVKTKYEAVEGNRHHHLVCRLCGTVVKLDALLPETLEKHLQERYQFRTITFDLLATGICEQCWSTSAILTQEQKEHSTLVRSK